jgi:type II secretion system protein H
MAVRTIQRAAPSSSGRRAGFSMIELMVVLAIVSIFAGMVIPSLGGTFKGALLRGTTRKLVAVLNLAGSLAITTGRVHRVRLDPREGRFWVDARAPSDAADYAPVSNVPGSAGRLDGRIRIEVGAPTEFRDGERAGAVSGAEHEVRAILFRPDGTTEGRPIRLADDEGFVMIVRTHPVTGRIRVIDEGREEAP